MQFLSLNRTSVL